MIGTGAVSRTPGGADLGSLGCMGRETLSLFGVACAVIIFVVGAIIIVFL